MTSLLQLSVGIAVFWTQFLTSNAFEGLHGYTSVNHFEVQDLANISKDVIAMNKALKRYADYEIGRAEAYNIYQFGGYSRSACTVDFTEGLPADLKEGTVFTALGEGGQPVKARLANDYQKGDTKIMLLYNQVLPCHVGGLHKDVQERDGCFKSPNTASFEHEGKSHERIFTYDPDTENTNDRTIQTMSTDARRKFRPNGAASHVYFDDFQKYVDYFGNPDFADLMITAAMTGGEYSFNEGKFDFSDATRQEKEDFIEEFAAFLNIGIYIQSELERSVEQCEENCPDGIHCRRRALRSLDSAVALYVGDQLEQNQAGDGALMYGLANRLCRLFKTCGENGGEQEGIAKVNYDMFDEFKAMKENIEADMCEDAKMNKETIMRYLSIPMVQGFKFAVYRRSADGAWGRNYEIEDAAVFAGGVLPLLGYCRMDEAKEIQLNFSPGNEQTTEDLQDIYHQLHEHYECIGVCCSDIGGLWYEKFDRYHKGAEPCVDTQARCVAQGNESKKSKKGAVGWIFFVVILAALGFGGYMYFKKRHTKKTIEKRAAENTDSDNSGEFA